MKILHVNNSPEGGGTETYINRLVPLLDKRGHRNKLFIQSYTPGDHPFSALKHTRLNIKALEKVLTSFQPDVIHVHNIINYRLIKRLLETGICLKSIHEFRPFCTATRIRADDGSICSGYLSGSCFRHGCFGLSCRSVYRFHVDRKAMNLIPEFKRIWVMSGYMKKMIEPLIPEQTRIEVVPYFFDSKWSKPPPPVTEARIFAAGRLVTGKGFDRFIQALSRLNLPYAAKIAGDGPEYNHLKALAEQLKTNVEFLGYLPADEVEQWYRWSRVVAFPSDYPEPFGIAGLEAMGAARPVVAFDVGGVREWLQYGITGFCVPRGDIEAFTERLRQLVSDPMLADEMGRAGWRAVKMRFSSDSHVRRLEDTYRQLAAHRDETRHH
ncbi:glycosyltransferase family 4 protein [bacterium]|nr:glycosyltransferase family 4 protein [candidate division CSSED10-310 bacterium]